MPKIFTLFASTTFLASACLSGSASALPKGQLPFDPKPSLKFNAAVLTEARLNTKDGYTYCDPDGWCMIPNMPVLYQTDPDVQKALADSMTKYIKIYFVQDPQVKDSKTGAIVPGWPGPSGYMSPMDESYAETEVGCALTAETMLVEAMLARAPKTAAATAKAKWYVDSDEAPSLSKVKSRLTWQYMQHLIAMHENQVHGPGLLYSSELAPLLDNWNIVPETLSVGSDGGPDDLEAVNTDFTSYSMTSMAEDIRNSALTRISFHWSQIGVVKTKDGVTHVIRYDVGQHKIALRGYSKTIVDAPKTYPILANDPGSGHLVKIRFTTDMNKYGVALLNGVPQKIEYDFYDGKTLTPLGSRVPAWMAMIYENDEPTVEPKGDVDVGLDTKVTMYGIQFVNGITSTFTQPPPKDPNNNPLRHPVARVFVPIPAIKPSSGPVEARKLAPIGQPGLKGAMVGH